MLESRISAGGVARGAGVEEGRRGEDSRFVSSLVASVASALNVCACVLVLFFLFLGLARRNVSSVQDFVVP